MSKTGSNGAVIHHSATFSAKLSDDSSTCNMSYQEHQNDGVKSQHKKPPIAASSSHGSSSSSSSSNNNNTGSDHHQNVSANDDDSATITPSDDVQNECQASTITNTPPTSSGSLPQPLSLLQAVVNGDVRKVRKMVVKGVSAHEANEKDAQGRTSLSIACANGMVLTVEFLSFIPEIDPNKCDNEGNTPLIAAAQAGHVDCIRILLKEFRNVRLDHQNRKGYTALIQAAINGRTDCAKVLLEAGANPFFADKTRKKNALQWAEFCGRTPCAAVIKEMSGRFPALVRHLVQAGQSVLTRHRSIWGSDGEIDRIAEREQMAAKNRGAGVERRGTISKLLQKSAKWIRSLSKKRKPSYRSLGALVSVGLAISGPAVTKQILDKSTLTEEEAKSPLSKGGAKAPLGRRASNKSSSGKHGPQSPPWRIPEVQIIAPSDEFGGRISVSAVLSNPISNNPSSMIAAQAAAIITSAAASASTPSSFSYNSNHPSSTNQRSSEVSSTHETTDGNVSSSSNRSSTVSNEAWGQNSSAPTSPVLSSRSAERAHRRRFAQRAAATTSRQQAYNHASYHEATIVAAAEHLQAIAAAKHFAEESSAGEDDEHETAGGVRSEVASALAGLIDESSIEEGDEEQETSLGDTGHNSTSSLGSSNVHHQVVGKMDSSSSAGFQ